MSFVFRIRLTVQSQLPVLEKSGPWTYRSVLEGYHFPFSVLKLFFNPRLVKHGNQISIHEKEAVRMT